MERDYVELIEYDFCFRDLRYDQLKWNYSIGVLYVVNCQLLSEMTSRDYNQKSLPHNLTHLLTTLLTIPLVLSNANNRFMQITSPYLTNRKYVEIMEYWVAKGVSV